MRAVIGRKLFLQSCVLPIGRLNRFGMWRLGTSVSYSYTCAMQLYNEVLLCFFYVRVGRQSLIRQLQQSRGYSITVEMRLAECVLVYQPVMRKIADKMDGSWQ